VNISYMSGILHRKVRKQNLWVMTIYIVISYQKVKKHFMWLQIIYRYPIFKS